MGGRFGFGGCQDFGFRDIDRGGPGAADRCFSGENRRNNGHASFHLDVLVHRSARRDDIDRSASRTRERTERLGVRYKITRFKRGPE